MKLGLKIALPFISMIPAGVVLAEGWTQFRGPSSNGVVEQAGLPVTWSKTENVIWKTPIPGQGWSSPVVVEDLVFLTSVISEDPIEEPKKGLYFGGNRGKLDSPHRWMVYCLDWKTGRILWEKEVHSGVPPESRHLKNTLASETPVTDGERLYAYFGNLGLYCLDFSGELLWSKSFPPRQTRYGWGTASSPVLHENRLYIVNDNEEESFLAAFDKTTGKEIWRSHRDEGSNWSTPYIWTNSRRTEIVTNGKDKVRSYDLDGKILWEFTGMSSIVIPTPFAAHGLLYLTSGYVGDENRPVYGIRSGAMGDITLPEGETSNEYVAWHLPKGGPYNPSPIVYGDLYYTLHDRGFLTCHDARTGKEIYGKRRIDPTAGAFTASPWAYDGKIFALSEDGDTFVIQAGLEFRVLGTNSLDEFSMASPAIYKGALIVRTASNLYRIGK